MIGNLSRIMGGLSGVLGGILNQSAGKGLAALFKANDGALGDLSKMLDKILQAKPAAEIKADAASIVQKITSKSPAGPAHRPKTPTTRRRRRCSFTH